MRSMQKKIKFTKGMITKALRERNDLPMYDSSAELIYNYVCTPYGGFRTRRGTRRIDKFLITETYPFTQEEEHTGGSFVDGAYTSGSLSSIQDGEEIIILDLGEERPEVSLYIDNIRLDYEEPQLSAVFGYTGTRFESVLESISIDNAGRGFTGYFTVLGQVLSGTTAINPIINSVGTITDVNFTSAIYKYLPENQVLGVYPSLPVCQVGVSVSDDMQSWSDEKLYSMTIAGLNIKEQSKQVRYVRIKYYGKPVNTRLMWDNVYAKYELVKILPFIYNVKQRNLIAISEKKIYIYQNHKLYQTIDIDAGLYFRDIRSVKYTQNEDVVIFTEAKVKPRELRRTTDTNGDIVWVFQEFPVINIPFHAFGGETKTAKTIGITPNYASGAVTITADSAVFDANSVGQQIDASGGRVVITQFISTTKIAGYTIIPFLNTDKITSWTYITGYENVWSEERGWPVACLFYQQRLWFGGSEQRPSTIWATRTGIYNDFNNAGNYDNDAINQDLNTENQIVNLLSNRGLQIFTSGDEWTASESSLTPNSFSVVKNTGNGSDIALTPKNLGGVTLFIEKNGKSLLSYVYDYNQAAYKTSNIGILTSLIDTPVDIDIDDNSSLDEGDYLYIVLADGRMLVTSINFEQEINATSIMEVNGQIQSVSNLINETYLLVQHNDGIYLEVIDDNVKSDLTIEKYVDQVADGLEEYEGEYVNIYKGDYRYIRAQVVDGMVNMPYAIKEMCSIGFSFSSKLVSNEIAINGRSTSLKKRIAKGVITASDDTAKVSFCGIDKTSEDGIFQFFGVSSYKDRLQFTVESEFNKVNIYSIMLNLNYGVG